MAVIDGSTSKTAVRLHPTMSNGRYAMTIVRNFIRTMPAEMTLADFLQGVTEKIAEVYNGVVPPSEERLTASTVVYSKKRQELWMVGDCQCMVDGKLHTNEKPSESVIAHHRASLIQQGMLPAAAREAIVPMLIKSMHEGQNISYAVFDGTPVYLAGVKVIDCRGVAEIVLASDGYPFLYPTLEATQKALSEQLLHDPQCIDTFVATKGLVEGNTSFDDCAYLRFEV